ncbi:MAG: ATP-binding protein [Planctomycetes bacterium]|nr:ATP-binding protein [Planctomycetota bacterium]
MHYVPRRAEDRLARLLKTFPAVLVHGPRQCGKSTLVRRRHPDWLHLDLERPADLGVLAADIEGFLDAHPRRVVIDEAQRLPALFPVLRHAIDRRPGKGRFLLLGSASPPLLRSVSESLAGRIGMLELTPLRVSEMAGGRHAADRWFWGGYPPVHALRGERARGDWLEGYVATFLERDLPALGFALPAQRLRTLWTMITNVHGRLLNQSDLARSLQVSVPTIAHYLDVLEAAFMIRRLQPYHANIRKRLVKSPKLYVRDTGLLHFLAGLRRPADLRTWPLRGNSFEGLVVEELATLAAERIARPGLFFWRTQAGAEVDLLIASGRRLIPIEIKLGASIDSHSLVGLRRCMQDLSLTRGWVVYTGSERRTASAGIEMAPWGDVAGGKADLGF